MKLYNLSVDLLICILIAILIRPSESNICDTCLCSTADDTSLTINCAKNKFVTINIIRFGLASTGLNLGTLDLSNNDITHLPVDLFDNSKSLRILNLSKNRLQEIHANVFKNLVHLKVLNLSHNEIKTYNPVILPSLNILDLSNNSLQDIDVEFHKAYPQLTDLNLSRNNLDDSINGTFNLFSNLQHLDISFNNFNLMDNENFNLLSKLVSLNLSHNAIKDLSIQTFPNSLKELNVGFNSLTKLPLYLLGMEILNIEYNKIAEIGNITNEFNKLKYLNVSGNILQNLADFKLSNLKTLDLSRNNFSQIPATLKKENYPALESLVINENPLNNIEFPSHLNVKSLTMRNLSHVVKISKNSFAKLNHLQDSCWNLTLTDNGRLSLIEEDTFKGLKLCYLDLKNNKFTSLTSKLLSNGFRAKNGVDLEGNPLHCNCSLQWMIDEFVPWLYSTNPELLNNLRCMSPDELRGKRMVHWYKWKEPILCQKMQKYSRMSAETLEVLSRKNMITLRTSNGMVTTVLIAMLTLLILVIVGIVFAKRVAMRRSRVNRRF